MGFYPITVLVYLIFFIVIESCACKYCTIDILRDCINKNV